MCLSHVTLLGYQRSWWMTCPKDQFIDSKFNNDSKSRTKQVWEDKTWMFLALTFWASIFVSHHFHTLCTTMGGGMEGSGKFKQNKLQIPHLTWEEPHWLFPQLLLICLQPSGQNDKVQTLSYVETPNHLEWRLGIISVGRLLAYREWSPGFDFQNCINLAMEKNAFNHSNLAGGGRLVRCSKSPQESDRALLFCKKVTMIST